MSKKIWDVTKPPNVGLLVTATGKYVRFLPQLAATAQQWFLHGAPLTVLCCTDHNVLPAIPDGTLHRPTFATRRLHADHLPWPGSTMYRFHFYLAHRELLEDFDVLFCCDADMRFEGPVGSEVIGDGVTATLHPGFYNKPRSQFSYETRPQSACYIPPDKGTHYFAGGFLGGTRDAFLSLADGCRQLIGEDVSRGITPVWHDESAVQKWLVDHPPAVILDSGYCMPEEFTLPYPRRLVALLKDHAALRA